MSSEAQENLPDAGHFAGAYAVAWRVSRVVAAITMMQSQGSLINFNTICRAAHVSKTFLYDPKHSDLAQQIRSLRQGSLQSPMGKATGLNKSDSAKDVQIARYKERVKTLEEQVRALQEENELLYGKLITGKALE